MNMSLSQSVGKAVVVLSIPILAACRNGYPTEDAPLADPGALTQEQLVEALNGLSEESRHGEERIYRLLSDCVLEIRGESPDSRHFPRLGKHLLGVASVEEDGDTSHLLTLIPRGELTAPVLTVFESRSRLEKDQARIAVLYLQKACRAATLASRDQVPAQR